MVLLPPETKKPWAWFRVAAVMGKLRFHLVDKPRSAGVGESEWIERELAALRDLGATLGLGE